MADLSRSDFPEKSLDPRHYRDGCIKCRDRGIGIVERLTIPHKIELKENDYVTARYFCQLDGHSWFCSILIQPGWYSDCSCTYCFVLQWFEK